MSKEEALKQFIANNHDRDNKWISESCSFYEDIFGVVYGITPYRNSVESPIQLLLKDEKEYFCNKHHIKQKNWNKYGCIQSDNSELDYIKFRFSYKHFLKNKFSETIKISRSEFTDPRNTTYLLSVIPNFAANHDS